ncbi:MAG: YIP1 family protein [Candidatus Eremiobacteraeota bacterium]|nr:YIP1 family protein [Candidatus Eremiobacteraeota bacterium]
MSEKRQASPWKDIWFRPRRAIGYVIDTNPENKVFALATAYAFVHAIQKSSEDSHGDRLDLANLIFAWGFAAVLWGPITLCLLAWIFRWIGNKLGGKCEDSLRVRAALAWGYVPYIFGIVPLTLIYCLMGFEMFTSEAPCLAEGPDSLLYGVVALTGVNIVLWVWSWFTTSHTLGEVFGFSAWKGFAVQILPGLVVFVVVVVAVLLSKQSVDGVIKALLGT